MKKITNSLMFLMAISLNGCFDPKILDPVALDFKRDACVNYSIVESSPKIIFQAKGPSEPISEKCLEQLFEKHKTNTLLCVALPQGLKIKSEYEADHQKD